MPAKTSPLLQQNYGYLAASSHVNAFFVNLSPLGHTVSNDMDSAKESIPQFLAPPKIAAIKNEEVAARVRMERTASQEIREERAELQEAAEQTSNVIIDLGSDGTVRWVSPSWGHVIGTPSDTIQGKPISNLLYDKDTDPFRDAMQSMQKNDSKSHIIRFRTVLAPESILYENSEIVEVVPQEADETETPRMDHVVSLEGQGIMITSYDRGLEGETHVSCSSIGYIL